MFIHDAQMPKPQLQQAAAMIILSNTTIIPARQCSTKQTASKLATSGSSSAAVGEMVASTTHGRAHEPAWPSRATRATRANGIRRRANLISYLISYLIIIYLVLSLSLRSVRSRTPELSVCLFLFFLRVHSFSQER